MALEACKLGFPANVWLQGSWPPGMEGGEGRQAAGHGDNSGGLVHSVVWYAWNMLIEQSKDIFASSVNI